MRKKAASDSRKRKRPEVKGRLGLFIEPLYAEPKANVNCNRFSPPAGFQALSQGTYGDVFVSKDRKTVLKCFVKDAEALHEYEMALRVMNLAPQYTAGPFELIQTHRPASVPYYMMSAQNAGPTLLHRMRGGCPPLTSDELCLCLLQTIHFTLLLGNEIHVADHHEENVCVAQSGSQIEVRWIDFGMWEKGAEDPARRPFALCDNAFHLCNLDEWRTIADTHPKVTGLLENFQDKNRHFPRVLSNAALTIQELRRVAQQLCERIASPQPPDRDCVYKSRALWKAIAQCEPPP